MNEQLTLNDGTVLQNSHALLSGDTLWLYLNGVSFSEAFELLSDADATEAIECDMYGEKTTYYGYADLFCLRRETSGMVTGGLKYAYA